MKHSVLLDTSFLIRLLNDEDPLHGHAKEYFRYFLEQEYILKVSTISIAEYCVLGHLDELPLKNLQIIPFNLDHAKKTGEFAKIVFSSNSIVKESLKPRAIIPNDSKLFAQADTDPTITHFVTSDARSLQVYKLLSNHTKVKFQIIDIHYPYNETFGVLDI
jgi:predicted nucleic acid-binding protein